MSGESGKSPKKLNEEELESLNRRMYTDTHSRKEKRAAELESKYYKTAAPRTLSQEEVESSATRQVDEEMKRRQRKRDELQAKYYKESEPKRMGHADVDDSVRRVYDAAMQHKQRTMEGLEKKYDYRLRSSQGPRISKEQLKASADRLSKPKKTTLTEEEINRVLGLV